MAIIKKTPNAEAISTVDVTNRTDFKALKEKFSKPAILAPKPLMFLIVGPRGSGKTFSLGSCAGTLLLFVTRQEHHSYDSAVAGKLHFKNPNSIIPFWLDMEDDGNIIENPEKVCSRFDKALDDLLAMEDVEKEFPYLALDSLNAFERYTSQKDNVKQATTYQKTTEATSNMVKVIINKLLRLRERGCNIIITVAAEVKEKLDGSGGVSVTPFLTGYRAVDEIIGSFPDIAVMVKLVDEDGKETYCYQFQNADGSKTGKKFTGEVTTSTFSTRLQTLPKYELPAHIPASINRLQKFIKDKFSELLNKQQVKEG